MPKLVARLGRRSTIVGLPPSAVPNFAKSLIVVARRGFSDAARRSIVSLSERSFFARAPLGCDVSRGRERDVRDESASVCLGGAGRQCVWMFGRRPGAPCSDTANTSVPWKESLQDTTRLYSKSGRLSRVITTRSH